MLDYILKLNLQALFCGLHAFPFQFVQFFVHVFNKIVVSRLSARIKKEKQTLIKYPVR